MDLSEDLNAWEKDCAQALLVAQMKNPGPEDINRLAEILARVCLVLGTRERQR